MIKPKKITPVFTSILVTFDKYESPETIANTNIIDPAKSKILVKEYQTVLAVGGSVRTVKSGDKIAINPMKYAKFKQVYQKNSLRNDVDQFQKEIVGFDFPTIEVDGKELMLLDERDVLYIVDEEYDDGEIPEKLINNN